MDGRFYLLDLGMHCHKFSQPTPHFEMIISIFPLLIGTFMEGKNTSGLGSARFLLLNGKDEAEDRVTGWKDLELNLPPGRK